jgi:hypothetical protein
MSRARSCSTRTSSPPRRRRRSYRSPSRAGCSNALRNTPKGASRRRTTRGLVDVKEIAEEVGGETEERLDRLLGDRTIRVPVEAWIGRDGLPARIGLDVNQDGQSFKMTADILEYGVPVDVKPPAEDATIEEVEFDRLTGG